MVRETTGKNGGFSCLSGHEERPFYRKDSFPLCLKGKADKRHVRIVTQHHGRIVPAKTRMLIGLQSRAHSTSEDDQADASDGR